VYGNGQARYRNLYWMRTFDGIKLLACFLLRLLLKKNDNIFYSCHLKLHILLLSFVLLHAEEKTLSPSMKVQHDACDILQPFFTSDGLIVNALNFAEKQVRPAVVRV